MAESTLSMVWSELQSRIASYMGWGRGAVYGDPSWTAQQQFELDGITASGLRRVYRPSPLDGERTSYSWSFLRPTATLAIDSAATTVQLPDDYGGLEGRMVLQLASGIQWWPLDYTGVGVVLGQQARYPTTTGRPQVCAEDWLKGTTGTQGQRAVLRFWPIADQAYTLKVQYYILGECLSNSFPYAYGGSALTEVILESCLAIAEQRLDDASGLHSMQFKIELAAAIANDRRSKPQLLGYNGDRSDMLDRRFGPWWHLETNGVMYNGNTVT